jgi:hypothetical protein
MLVAKGEVMKTITGTVVTKPRRFSCEGVWDSHFDLKVEGRKRDVSIFVRKPRNPLSPPLRLCCVRVGETLVFRAERLEGSHFYGVFHDEDFLEWNGMVWDGNNYVPVVCPAVQ